MQSHRVYEFPTNRTIHLTFLLHISMQIKVGHSLVFQSSIDFGSDYKVNNKHPVMVFENAAKHDHVCMCAHVYSLLQQNAKQ